MSKHTIAGGDLPGLFERFDLLQEKAQARTGQDFPIVVIQEAGLDGFWIHRALENEGVESHVVDPASIATARLEALCTGDGRELPDRLKGQIVRELDRLELLMRQIKAIEGERDALIAEDAAAAQAAMLMKLKGVGPEFAAVLWSESLFRRFDNRRQVAAYAGLAPTPWQSGQIDREQGVSKGGNPRLRAMLVQLSWLWLRHQPWSALTLWFEERVKQNGGRLRKPTILALARKLLVALWKYVTAGVVIEGAVLSPV